MARVPQLPASENSLVVEPTFLQRVSDVTFDESDREMKTVVTHARDQADGQCYVWQHYGVPFVYRKHNAV